MPMPGKGMPMPGKGMPMPGKGAPMPGKGATRPPPPAAASMQKRKRSKYEEDDEDSNDEGSCSVDEDDDDDDSDDDDNGEDGNERECHYCGEIGELLCCDGCPRVFHFECLIPPMRKADMPKGDWYCPLCKQVLGEDDEREAAARDAALNGAPPSVVVHATCAPPNAETATARSGAQWQTMGAAP